MASTYVFRDDLEAEKQRAQELATQGLANPLQPSQPAPQPTQPAAQPLGQALAAQTAPKAPSQPENPFEAFGKALEAQNPFRQQTKTSVQTALANPYEGADAANKAARDRLAREQNAAQEQARIDAITTYGGGATGQVGQSAQQVRNARLMNDQAFELDAAANRAAQGEQVRSNAIGQATNLLGQDIQSAQTAAGLADAAANRAFSATEAEKARTFQAGESQLDRVLNQSQFAANLGLSQQQLAETVRQFNSKQDFDRWAVTQNINQQEAERIWQASEADKARAFQAGESQLDRALSATQFNSRLGIDKAQLAETIRQFDNKAAFDKYALDAGISQQVADRLWQSSENDKQRASQEKIVDKQLSQSASQFTSELDFKKWATEGGWTQDQINRAWQSDEAVKERTSRETIAKSEIGSRERMQAVEQVFQSAEAEKARVLETMLQSDRIKAQFQMAEIENTFAEKMQTVGYLQNKELQVMKQDFEKSLQEAGISADMAKQLSDQQFRSLEADRDRTFNASQNQLNQAWQTGERLGAQDWQSSMQSLEFKQQDLMQQREEALKLGMQTNEIDAEMNRVGMQIASQELMASAQLAQQDSQFREEMMMKWNISAAELDQNRIRLEDDLANSLASRTAQGLQNEALKASLQSDKVRSAMELASFGMEMGNGSPESMAPFVAQIGTALEAAFKEQGIDIRAEDFAKAFTPTTPTTPSGTGTNDDVQLAKDVLADATPSLQSSVDTDLVTQYIESVASSDVNGISTQGRINPDDLPTNIKKPLVLNGGLLNVGGGNYVIDEKSPNKQLTIDTIGLYQMIQEGIPAETAKKILVQAIGQARYDAAKKLVG